MQVEKIAGGSFGEGSVQKIPQPLCEGPNGKAERIAIAKRIADILLSYAKRERKPPKKLLEMIKKIDENTNKYLVSWISKYQSLEFAKFWETAKEDGLIEAEHDAIVVDETTGKFTLDEEKFLFKADKEKLSELCKRAYKTENIVDDIARSVKGTLAHYIIVPIFRWQLGHRGIMVSGEVSEIEEIKKEMDWAVKEGKRVEEIGERIKKLSWESKLALREHLQLLLESVAGGFFYKAQEDGLIGEKTEFEFVEGKPAEPLSNFELIELTKKMMTGTITKDEGIRLKNGINTGKFRIEKLEFFDDETKLDELFKRYEKCDGQTTLIHEIIEFGEMPLLSAHAIRHSLIDFIGQLNRFDLELKERKAQTVS